MKISLAVCVAAMATAVPASAAPFSSSLTVDGFSDVTGSNRPNPFTIDLATPTTAADAGLLTIEAFGDFNSLSEFFAVSVETVSFGILWDSVPGNDRFIDISGADNDVGNQYRSSLFATALIPTAELNGYLADGMFSIGFGPFGPRVDNLSSPTNEFITATLEFETGGTPVVPEPSGLTLAALAAGIGCVVRRRRKVESGPTE